MQLFPEAISTGAFPEVSMPSFPKNFYAAISETIDAAISGGLYPGIYENRPEECGRC